MWAAINDVIPSIIRVEGDSQSQDAAWRVKWSYWALAHQYDNESVEAPFALPLEYHQLREEQRERGEEKPGIELTTFTQVKTLQWLLDQAEVPVTLGDTPVCILLAPFEQSVQASELPRRRFFKHEKTSPFETVEPVTDKTYQIDLDAERK